MRIQHTHDFLRISSVLIAAVLTAGLSRAACIPQNLATPAPRDPVARVLAKQLTCPANATEFSAVFKQMGARLEPTMVNFAGFHNPAAGAFFIFEIASTTGAGAPGALTIDRGDLFFGHFTSTTNGGGLVSNESGLEIELIAWDPDKQFYNFYELVSGKWFYRGDSKDIADDIELLHRQRTLSQTAFGPRLRCSGCHVNGGLLQKELTAPHNDWFVPGRSLPLGSLKPDQFVKGKLADLVDASELSKLVTASAQRLAASPGYQRTLAMRNMQERLRPLFCPVELNIESDMDPLDDRKPSLRVPGAFFADLRLGSTEISVPRQHYDAAIQTLRSSLPDSQGRADADHGWLTPVKAQSDMVAVDNLVAQGVIDKEFMSDVLAVDFTNPVFSRTRCGLLQAVPVAAGPDFMSRLQRALQMTNKPGARELLTNLTDPKRDAAFHENQATVFLANCKQQSQDPAAILGWVRLLFQRRAEVSASEISQSRRGHILEDPNRTVFPSIRPPSVPERLALTTGCKVQ